MAKLPQLQGLRWWCWGDALVVLRLCVGGAGVAKLSQLQGLRWWCWGDALVVLR